METITFTCRIITPMFLAGADGKTPELRAASVKGALRFWWRACNGHLGLEEMRKKEQEIFGGVKPGEARRSGVLMRVKGVKVKVGQLPNSQADKEKNPGIHYLWYTVGLKDNRPAIWEGTFELILSARDHNHLKSASMCLWLLSQLGGLGTRARRGGGAFLVEKSEGKADFEFLQMTDETHEAYFQDRLNKISSHFGFSYGFDTSMLQDFPQLSNAQIHIADLAGQKPLVALERIGSQFQEFRHLRQPDYDEVKSYISSGKTPSTVPKVEFGLPLSFRYRSLEIASATIQGPNRIDRSASSMLISIVKWGEEYRPILTNFATELLPSGAKPVIKSVGKKTKTISQSFQGIKELFISSLTTLKLR